MNLRNLLDTVLTFEFIRKRNECL